MAKGHIRQRGPESWAIKIDIGADPATGKRRTKWHTVRGTKRDAERERNRLLRELDVGEYVEPSKMTVAELLRRWLDDIKHKVGGKTFSRYREIVETHLAPALGGHKLAKLSALHISAAYAAAMSSGRRDGKGGLSAQTVKHHHRVLWQALDQAVRWQVLARNPAALVDPPRPARTEMKILDQAQTATLLKAIRHTRTYMPVMLAVTTGMRRGEILALRWSDLDLDRARLQVVRSLEETSDGLRFKSPKTSRSRRTITLPSLAVEELKRHRARQAEERLALGLGRDPDGLVVCRHDGEPLQPRSLTHEFTRLVQRAGVPRIRFHDLRHTHLSHLLAAGVNPKIASERAGHASVSITLDVYSHVLPGLQEDVAKTVDASLRKALES